MDLIGLGGDPRKKKQVVASFFMLFIAFFNDAA